MGKELVYNIFRFCPPLEGVSQSDGEGKQKVQRKNIRPLRPRQRVTCNCGAFGKRALQ